jgi:serine/threonine protein kinase
MADSSSPLPGQSEGLFSPGHDGGADAPPQSSDALLFGRYRVIRELGRGGMGVVLLAHDTALEIPVAVKLVPDLVVKDTEAIADLRREVLRGMALNHDGVVRTHHFEKVESGAGIVMEFVEGDTLADLKTAQPGGCLNPEQILGWLAQLCAVLDYAHREKNFIHRDLKPRNIMLTKSGRLKVADFGIAAVISDSVSRHSLEGKVSGTLCYMSPQQAEGKRPSHLDDIHALGATIYELLTGKPPFFRGNQATIYQQIINVVPPSMTERREELDVAGKPPLPPPWEKTIAACLAKDPARRPQSAGEVLTQLRLHVAAPAAVAAVAALPHIWTPERVRQERSSKSYPRPIPPPPLRVVPPVALRRSPVPVFAALLVIASLGVGYWRFSIQQPRSQEDQRTASLAAERVTAEKAEANNRRLAGEKAAAEEQRRLADQKRFAEEAEKKRHEQLAEAKRLAALTPAGRLAELGRLANLPGAAADPAKLVETANALADALKIPPIGQGDFKYGSDTSDSAIARAWTLSDSNASVARRAADVLATPSLKNVSELKVTYARFWVAAALSKLLEPRSKRPIRVTEQTGAEDKGVKTVDIYYTLDNIELEVDREGIRYEFVSDVLFKYPNRSTRHDKARYRFHWRTRWLAMALLRKYDEPVDFSKRLSLPTTDALRQVPVDQCRTTVLLGEPHKIDSTTGSGDSMILNLSQITNGSLVVDTAVGRLRAYGGGYGWFLALFPIRDY